MEVASRQIEILWDVRWVYLVFLSTINRLQFIWRNFLNMKFISQKFRGRGCIISN